MRRYIKLALYYQKFQNKRCFQSWIITVCPLPPHAAQFSIPLKKSMLAMQEICSRAHAQTEWSDGAVMTYFHARMRWIKVMLLDGFHAGVVICCCQIRRPHGLIECFFHSWCSSVSEHQVKVTEEIHASLAICNFWLGFMSICYRSLVNAEQKDKVIRQDKNECHLKSIMIMVNSKVPTFLIIIANCYIKL